LAPTLATEETAEPTLISEETEETEVLPGDVVKAEDSSTVYYVGDDNKRHVFPNAKIYKSWYSDYSSVKKISQEELQDIPFSTVNVTYKPGAKLIKLTTDPRVYAVGNGGTLHWVQSEELAESIYGDEWAKQVEDLPDQFFASYETGDAIDEEQDYDKEELEESAPEIRHSIVDLKLTETVSATIENGFNGDYTITYDLSKITITIAGRTTTASMSDITKGVVTVGTIDIPASIADKIDAELSHHINMAIGEKKFLGVKKITMTNLDGDTEPNIDGIYTERNQNFVFGKLKTIDPPANECGVLGGSLVSGHFVSSGIENGKTTIGFIAGCKGILLAARATVNWTAVGGLMSVEDITEIVEVEEKVCIDDTPYGECSDDKPNYCDEGRLRNNCKLCGCDAGYACHGSGISCFPGGIGEICNTNIDDDGDGYTNCQDNECVGYPGCATCSETDAGDDAYTKGTTTGKWGCPQDDKPIVSHTDKCLDATRLEEYLCNGGCDNILGHIIECPYGCSDGACLAAPTATCSDSDGGIDAYTKGSTTGHWLCPGLDQPIMTKTDYCSGEMHLHEFSCDSDCDHLVSTSIECPYGCSDGVCLQEPRVCTDSDDGQDLATKGTTTGAYTNSGDEATESDSCSSTSVLTEYYCDDGLMKSSSHTCSGMCFEGVCLDEENPFGIDGLQTAQATEVVVKDTSYREDYPLIEGNRIFWQKIYGTFDLYYKDIDVNKETLIGQEIDYYDVHNNTLVWTGKQSTDTYNKVHVVDLTTLTETNVIEADHNLSHADIYGQDLVYSQWDTSINKYVVYHHDLATDTKQLISPAGERATHPFIDGSYVVWYDSGWEQNAAYLYNLDTKELINLVDLSGLDLHPSGIDVEGNYVALSGLDQDLNKLYLYVYDIAAGTFTKMEHSEGIFNFDLGNNLLVWGHEFDIDYGRDIVIYLPGRDKYFVYPKLDYQNNPRTYDDKIIFNEYADNGNVLYISVTNL